MNHNAGAHPLISGLLSTARHAHPWRAWRRARRRAQLKKLAREPNCRLVIGAASIAPEGWIGSDINELNVLVAGDWERYFLPNSVAAMLAEHVWEHLTLEEGLQAAQLCHQFLAPEGYLRIAVPDGFHPDADYIEYVRPGGIGPGADDHRVLYTHVTLSSLLQEAGFQTRLLEYHDSQGKFHFHDWQPADGLIRRSRRYDPRNQDGQLKYTSLIIDASKAS